MNRALVLLILLAGCGNSRDIEFRAPGVVSGTLTIRSLENQKVVFESDISGNGTFFIPAYQISLGMEPLRVEISKAVYKDRSDSTSSFEKGETFMTLLSSKNSEDLVNINPVTTLAACRYDFQASLEGKTIDEKIQEQKSLLENQLNLNSMDRVSPAENFSSLENMTESEKYGLILKGFEILATWGNLRISELVQHTCEDVRFDGKLNGVGKQGKITDEIPFLDDQILKARLAGAIFELVREQPQYFHEEKVRKFVSDISLRFNPEFFSSATLNYVFETISPSQIQWFTPVPAGQLSNNVQLHVLARDQDSNPTQVKAEIIMEKGERHALRDQIRPLDEFRAVETLDRVSGPATVLVRARDLFGNEKTWTYPIRF